MSLEVTRRLADSQAWLDGIADWIHPRLQRLLDGSPAARNALDGRWLGAPLHPALTDVPVGAWSAAFLLDLFGPRDRSSGDGPLAVGVVAAVPTALTGASDWAHLRGEQRRIGSLHAMLNGGALLLNAASLALRAAGHRGSGKTLSFAAYGLVLASAHLGGQLVLGLGARVNRTAWEKPGENSVAVLDAVELEGSAMKRVEVDGVPVLVARSAGGELCAIAATCSHLGGPLDEGERRGDTVVCPWHGSRFDLCTGEVVDAPAVFSQPRYDTREQDGQISVRHAS
jgi:nitrite reductase/ring-hydroxylating ferredoxin subunit